MWRNPLKAMQSSTRRAIDACKGKGLSLGAKQGIAFILLTVCVYTTAHADIYFLSRTIGPSTNIYSVNAEGIIKKITDNDAWKDAEMQVPPTGDIVFMSNRKDKLKIDLHKHTEDFNIFKINQQNGKLQQLTSTPDFEHSPTISNDGRWIAWLQKAGNYRKLLLLKNGETTPKTVAIADDIYSLSWASNNHILSFSSRSEKKSQLFMYNINDSSKTLLLEVATMPQGTNGSAKREISEASYNNLLKDADTNEGRVIVSAQWSPDGKKIAAIISATTTQTRELQVLDPGLKTSSILSKPGVQVQYPVSWSPDSKTVLYSGLIDYKFYFDEQTQRKVYEGSMQIYLADLEGEVKQLTEGEYMHNRPVFSPDGTHIAFLFAQTLGDRTLALHTLSLQDKKRREYYDRVAGDSPLFWR